MATRTIRVLLGFDDVPLTDEFKHILHFTFSKIGGVPDYPTNFKLDPPICPLCQLPRPLVIQLYVPLRGSVYHRTFYVFACINPNCWGSSESWLCIRVQTPKKLEDPPKKVTSVSKNSPTDWCSGADDWDDNMANVEEENGNVVSNLEKVSDEDDESCSLEDSLQSCFESMTVDDRNANEGAQGLLIQSINLFNLSLVKEETDWFKFDDSRVTKCSGDALNLLEPLETPYILFYEREDIVRSRSSDDVVLQVFPGFPAAEKANAPLESMKSHLIDDEKVKQQWFQV